MATRVVSEVQKINSAIADVYAFLSDFSKIGKLIETARQMGAGNQMPELADKIEDVRTTVDACTFMVKGVGEMGMKIVEREEPKLIKLEGDGRLPFEFQVWIQLLDNGPYVANNGRGGVEHDDENVAEGETGKGNQSTGRRSGKNSLRIYTIIKKLFIAKSFFGYLDRSSKSMSSNLFVSTSSWTAIVSPLRATLM